MCVIRNIWTRGSAPLGLQGPIKISPCDYACIKDQIIIDVQVVNIGSIKVNIISCFIRKYWIILLYI